MQQPQPQLLRGILLTAIGAFWGAAYLIPYKVAAVQAGAARLVLPLLLIAAAFNTAVLVVRSRPSSWRISRRSLLVALVMGLCAALGNEAAAQALTAISPGVAAVMLRSQVLLVALGGIWLLGEHLSRRFWLGTFLALAGFGLMQGDLFGEQGPPVVGMAWVLLAAGCFAVIQLVTRKVIAEIDIVFVNSARLWIAAAAVACVPGRVDLLAQTDGRIWLLVGAAAVCGPVLSRSFMMLALRHIPVALATLVLFAGPVFAFVLAGLVLGDWPSLLELLGSAVILVGIALPVLEMARARLRAGAPSLQREHPKV